MTGHVDGKDSRSGLRYYHDVHKLLFVHPLVLIHKLSLHDGDHGITSSQGECPNLVARREKFNNICISVLIWPQIYT